MNKIHISNIVEITQDKIYYRDDRGDVAFIELEPCANNYEATHRHINQSDCRGRCVGNRFFGEYAYYFKDNFDAVALANPLLGGNKYTITLKVYDCKGNLDDNARGAFVVLNMTGGGQNSAECNYKLTADPNVPGLYTLTFTDSVPYGTDSLLFYQIEPCEFYIASITVKVG